ncbi:NYN domain-containing protein [Candidatus Amesbacteria bacterium]|nr:NYN domain-containing protein [Candidatus Amesbacteria bacterium]
MSQCVLFVDGENFLHKVREVLKTEGIDKTTIDLAKIDLNKLLAEPLKGFKIKRKIFYVSRLHSHPETKKKSEELIKFQRSLRNSLMNQGFEFVIAGNVRAQKVGNSVVFREKGVDVKIAVDLVSLSAKKALNGKSRSSILVLKQIQTRD